MQRSVTGATPCKFYRWIRVALFARGLFSMAYFIVSLSDEVFTDDITKSNFLFRTLKLEVALLLIFFRDIKSFGSKNILG